MTKSNLTKYGPHPSEHEAEALPPLRARLQRLGLERPFDPAEQQASPSPSVAPSVSEEAGSKSFELLDVLRMLRDGWWIIALTTLAAIAMALLSVYLATPLYEASAQFILAPNETLTGTQAVYGLESLNKRSIVTTYAELLDSSRIYQETGAMLQLAPETLTEYERSTVILPETTILELSVTGPDAQVAALLANSIGQRMIEYVKGLYQAYDVNFLNLATPVPVPISPKPVQSISLALGLGLILGIGLALVRGFLSSDKSLGMILSSGGGQGAEGKHAHGSAQSLLQQELMANPLQAFSLALLRVETLPPWHSLPAPLRHTLHADAMSLLQQELRGKDLVISWDEQTMAVLLPDVPGNKSRRALDHIRHMVVDTLTMSQQGMPLEIDLRIGVTERLGGESASLLLQQAEIALDRATHEQRPSEFFTLSTDLP